MNRAFSVVFWAIVLVVLVLGFIYTYFGYTAIGDFEEVDDTARTVEARDFLLWSLTLEGVALGLATLVLIYGIVFGWGRLYNTPTHTFFLYMFFFVWILITLVLVATSYERISASIDVLASNDLRIAKTDIVVAMLSLVALIILLLVGYFGYIYRYDHSRNVWFETCLS